MKNTEISNLLITDKGINFEKCNSIKNTKIETNIIDYKITENSLKENGIKIVIPDEDKF